MPRRVPVVAIVGRTNVGKSTLFNSIAGRRLAVVSDRNGVTRDRLYALINRFDIPFSLVDTGGVVGEEDSSMLDSVREQAALAIAEAEVIIAVFDGIHGLHPDDEHVVDLLRASGKKIFWVVNKCEKAESEITASELYTLGLNELHTISAAHNQGIRELIVKVGKELRDSYHSKEIPDEDELIRVAILGKPNVGKSTIVNTITGTNRVIASNKPGTTRDSIDVELTRDGQHYVLVDTAGLRRKARVDDSTIERYSNLRTVRSLMRADVAVLLFDAEEGLPTDQDMKIASLINERGKGLVIVVNKWDAIEKDHKTSKKFKDDLSELLPFVRYAPIVFTSALTGKRCPSVLQKVKEVHEASNYRIPTADLNQVLNSAMTRKPPPVYRGQPLKLFFATQIGTQPPTFILFFNHPDKLRQSYIRFLKGVIRKYYPFEGCDLKLIVRKRTPKQERRIASGE